MDSPDVPRRYSDQQYRDWLAHVLDSLRLRLDEHKWPKGANQFGYLSSEVTLEAWALIDPERTHRWIDFDDPAHSSRRIAIADPRLADNPRDLPLSLEESERALYRFHYLGGDHKAIFEYAASSLLALRADWVIEQLIAWRHEGTPEAERNFKRFMQEHWHPTGVNDPTSTFRTIERDQEIFCAYLGLQGSATEAKLYEVLAENAVNRGHSISAETVKHVVRVYKSHHRSWITGALGPSPRPPR